MQNRKQQVETLCVPSIGNGLTEPDTLEGVSEFYIYVMDNQWDFHHLSLLCPRHSMADLVLGQS